MISIVNQILHCTYIMYFVSVYENWEDLSFDYFVE